MRVWPGAPYPLGATWDGVGVNFAIFSEHATRVELCLFDSADGRSRVGNDSTARTHRHGVARVSAGRTAGAALRISRARPVRSATRATASIPTSSCWIRTRRSSGERCAGTNRCSGFSYGHDDTTFDERDSAPYAPLAAVIDSAFTWGDDRPLRTPWHETLIYELHVKGFSKLQPAHPGAAARHLSRARLGTRDSRTSPRSA